MLEFPIDIFPNPVKDYIIECNTEGGLVKEFLCGTALGMLSTILGNKIKLKVSANHTESAMLWIALVGNSGSKKTPSINSILQPLYKIEQESFKNYKKELEHFKSDDSIDIKPRYKQLMVDDITIESLLKVMQYNSNGLLMKKDELPSLISEALRYGGGNFIQKLLSIYSQTNLVVNRKGDDEVIVIDKPFLSLIGGIQPQLLPELFKDNRDSSGFINRILFTYPTDILMQPPTNNFNTDIKRNYQNFVLTLYHKVKQIDETGFLALDEKSSVIYSKWQKDFIYPLLNDETQSGVIIGCVSKLEAVALRIALIIEVSFEDRPNYIPKFVCATAMRLGIEAAEYYYYNFLEVSNSVTPERRTPQKEINCLQDYTNLSINILDKDSKKAMVSNLLNLGHPNSIISKVTGIPKSTISGYTGGK